MHCTRTVGNEKFKEKIRKGKNPFQIGSCPVFWGELEPRHDQEASSSNSTVREKKNLIEFEYYYVG